MRDPVEMGPVLAPDIWKGLMALTTDRTHKLRNIFKPASGASYGQTGLEPLFERPLKQKTSGPFQQAYGLLMPGLG